MKRIALHNRIGEVTGYALIDNEDFERVNAHGWYIQYNKNHEYVVTYRYEGKKKIKMWLHRFIMDAPQGLVVDHINHKTMDNRKKNLRVCDYRTNNNNLLRKRQYPSGIYITKRGRYELRVSINKKHVYLGRYDTLQEALTVRERAITK